MDTVMTSSDNPSVHFIVEGDKHDIFEIRFHKINHRGDISLCSFDIDSVVIEADEESHF